jgi:hypothetical protein
MDDRRLNEIRERCEAEEAMGFEPMLIDVEVVTDLLDHIDDLKFRQQQDAATIWALMDVLPGREEMSEAQWEVWRQALRSEAVQEIQAVYGERDRLTVAYYEIKTKYELERAIYRKENEALSAEVERLQAVVKESLTAEPSGNSGELPPGYTLQGPVHNDWWWSCGDVEGDRYEYLEPVFESAWRHYRANGGGR